MEAFGGSDGLRDANLLASTVAQPSATFGGSLLHEDLFAMAAAYLFHIVMNHPFIDGNKRTGLAAALVFLDINGLVSHTSATESLYTSHPGRRRGPEGQTRVRGDAPRAPLGSGPRGLRGGPRKLNPPSTRG